MKTVTINIETTNSAFGEYPEYEIARILREIAEHFEQQQGHYKVYDVNGNVVGGTIVK